MLIPSSKLLWYVGVAAVPLAGVGFSVVGHPLLSVLLLVAFGSVILGDAAVSFGMLRDARVACPSVLRGFKDRELALPVRIEAGSGEARVAVALPEVLETERPLMRVALPSEGACMVEWPVTARVRGSFRLSDCGIEKDSRLGFWLVRRRFPLNAEVRVYPNVHVERNVAAAVFLNRGAFGVHSRRQVGKGREFQQLRDYVHGDSFEDVHWKATAKRGHPVTKVYQVERTQEVHVVVDASRLSGRVAREPSSDGVSGRPVTVLERFIVSALLLGRAASRQGDRFGLIAFSDRILHFVRAAGGQSAHRMCNEALYGLQPSDVAPDFHEVCSFIRMRLTRRSLVIFLTSLDDPALAGSFAKAMELLQRQHLVLVFALPPEEVRHLFSGREPLGESDLHRAVGGHLAWERMVELQQALRRRDVRMAMPRSEAICMDLVSAYLNVKQRQLL